MVLLSKPKILKTCTKFNEQQEANAEEGNVEEENAQENGIAGMEIEMQEEDGSIAVHTRASDISSLTAPPKEFTCLDGINFETGIAGKFTTDMIQYLIQKYHVKKNLDDCNEAGRNV